VEKKREEIERGWFAKVPSLTHLSFLLLDPLSSSHLPLSPAPSPSLEASPSSSNQRGKEKKWIEEEERIKMRCFFGVDRFFPTSIFLP